MTDRERFLATMRYEPRDRCPICDFKFWEETLPIWKQQGLPEDVTWGNSEEWLGMDNWEAGVPANIGMQPDFGWVVKEDRGDHEVIQQGDGVLVLRKKEMGSIPMHLGHTLKDRASWEEHYKWRLDPKVDRLSKDWAAFVKKANSPEQKTLVTIGGGSLYGWLRNWMGMEELSCTVYEDPELFEEMVGTLGDLIVSVHEKIYASGLKVDAIAMWEDMCYNAGPLLGPAHFKEFLVPQYKRITSLARKNGVDVIYLDSDGKIDALLPMWLESGVNTLFPIEIGTWGADPLAFRKQFGKDMRMLGGFDKHILSHGKDAIDREIDRLAPVVEEGGFIPFADHRVPPDVPFKNYLHYLDRVRQVWGRGINLKPFHPKIQSLIES